DYRNNNFILNTKIILCTKPSSLAWFGFSVFPQIYIRAFCVFDPVSEFVVFSITHDQLQNSPSRKDNIDEPTETTLRIYGCDLIQESGILLRLYALFIARSLLLASMPSLHSNLLAPWPRQLQVLLIVFLLVLLFVYTTKLYNMAIETDGTNGSLILLKQGAEARIFESAFVGRRSIIKERFSKKYRHPSLDLKLTLKRLNAVMYYSLSCCSDRLSITKLLRISTRSSTSALNEALRLMNEALDLYEKGLHAARTRECMLELKELKSKTLRFISAVHLQMGEFESVIKCVKVLREGPHVNAHKHHVDNELRMLERFGKSFVIKYEGSVKNGDSDCFVLEHVEHDRPEGVIHRDVKPGNFLLSRKASKGYLIDFNLAMDLHQKYGNISKSRVGCSARTDQVKLPSTSSTQTKDRKLPNTKSSETARLKTTNDYKSTLDMKNIRKRL
ncbi:hypothetical protein G4B88_014369, partial [Cannabis sativa]